MTRSIAVVQSAAAETRQQQKERRKRALRLARAAPMAQHAATHITANASSNSAVVIKPQFSEASPFEGKLALVTIGKTKEEILVEALEAGKPETQIEKELENFKEKGLTSIGPVRLCGRLRIESA